MSDRSEPASRVMTAARDGAARPAAGRARRTAALLATASLVALLCRMPQAAAGDCVGPPDAPPADIATPTMLYETLRTRTSAQLLAIRFLRKPVAEECPWIYEVKMLTASGSVVELDFSAADLGLIGARGPENDRDAMALIRGFDADADVLVMGSEGAGRGAGSADPGSASGDGNGGGNDGNDVGDGDEGGNSGSGSSSSGSGSGGSGSSGSGGGDGDDGGDGGDGEGGGDDGGGEGGDD